MQTVLDFDIENYNRLHQKVPISQLENEINKRKRSGFGILLIFSPYHMPYHSKKIRITNIKVYKLNPATRVGVGIIIFTAI